jgi:iron complex transport system substrate-binding protein
MLLLFRSSIRILALVIFAGGCSNEIDFKAQTGAGISVVDGLGRSLSISASVTRIVSLAPGATEIIFAAGGLDALVGVTTADNFPPSVKTLPSFSALPVNFESVIALEPDVVFASAQVNNINDATIFEQVGIPVYYFESGSLDDVLDGIKSAGTILGTELYANKTVDSLAMRIDRLEQAVNSISHRPSVLVLLSAATMYSFGGKSYVRDLVRLGGGKGITDQLDQDAVNLSDEFVIIERPDVILGTFESNTGAGEFIEHHPQWTSVPAIMNDAIYSLPSDLILRPGPRNIDAAERILSLLHPDLALTITDDID